MSLFKLYCQFNLKKKPVYKELFDIDYINSVSPFYFGLNIDINSVAYSKYQKKVEKIFFKSKVESFFVTETKFEEIIEYASSFNVVVKNTNFNFKPDNYNSFERHLFKQDLSNKEMFDYLKEFKSQGAELKSLSLMLKGNNGLFSLYDDGFIYLSNDDIAKDKLFKEFLESLLTGRGKK